MAEDELEQSLDVLVGLPVLEEDRTSKRRILQEHSAHWSSLFCGLYVDSEPRGGSSAALIRQVESRSRGMAPCSSRSSLLSPASSHSSLRCMDEDQRRIAAPQRGRPGSRSHLSSKVRPGMARSKSPGAMLKRADPKRKRSLMPFFTATSAQVWRAASTAALFCPLTPWARFAGRKKRRTWKLGKKFLDSTTVR